MAWLKSFGAYQRSYTSSARYRSGNAEELERIASDRAVSHRIHIMTM